jgi:hypothetical protein
MRREEYEGIPARWLMVPAGVEIDLDPPCAAVCRRCGGAVRPDGAAGRTARPDPPSAAQAGRSSQAAETDGAGSCAGKRGRTYSASS